MFPLVSMKELLSITKNPELLCRKTVRRLLSVFLKPKDRPYKSQFFPWNEARNIMKMYHFWFAQKACFRVRGYRRCLGLMSWRCSLGKIDGRSQVEGWARPAGRGSAAGHESQRWLLWCQDSSVRSLPKREMQLLREDLPQLGICGLYSLFRRKKLVLFYDGLEFLCDSFF